MITKRTLEDVSIELYNKDENTKEKFNNLGISSVDVRKIIRDILEFEPIIGIPIDNVPNDLNDWARQQKHKVKIWIVNKFVEFNNPTNIVYEFPEEFKPILDTEEESKPQKANTEINQYEVGLIDLLSAGLLQPNDNLVMIYKPRNGLQKKYDASVKEDGSIEVLGRIFSSPSYAALAGIKDAGSSRDTVNGWMSWKTLSGKTLSDLREYLLNTTPTKNN